MLKFPYIDGIHEDHEMGRLEHLHAKTATFAWEASNEQHR